jgi:hypothetical protein
MPDLFDFDYLRGSCISIFLEELQDSKDMIFVNMGYDAKVNAFAIYRQFNETWAKVLLVGFGVAPINKYVVGRIESNEETITILCRK